MSALEGCGSISNSNGQLLFYVSPENIWNRQNQIMPNGSGLIGTQSNQQVAIVKNPANINQYYVFITAYGVNPISTTNRISYSIVDMSLGPIGQNTFPLGDVVQNFKNIPLLDNLGNNFGTEAITIVAGTTIDTYWVLIPNGNSLYSYKIDSQGLNNNPVISNLNFPVTLNNGKFYSIKASPKINNQNFTNYICISHWADYVNNTEEARSNNRVLSFNAATGTITNDYSLNVIGIRAYLPEFNKNASVLFLGNTSIFAVDLLNSTTGNVNSMQIYTDTSTSQYTAIQRDKRGHIYLNRPSINVLGEINNPDVYGSNMSVTPNAVNLGTGHYTNYGLPQLIPTFENTYYPCIENLTLISEPNLNFTYEIGKKITTQDSYILGSRHNITMQAGETVSLLPGTSIQSGAYYHAFIAPCGEQEGFSKFNQNKNQKDMVLNLDVKERKATNNTMIDIYPNPTSIYVNIISDDQKITSWELYDISGKSVLKGILIKLMYRVCLKRLTY
ncbi:3-coathanger stack domain-containing protein [Chryseobacterium sp. S-02]|uniref:3-coathanger stack domain-containing protein n=1 Tax=Chryseobacterium sp. S-02 TaxID=3404064 RepID=UPI003CF8D75A